MTTLLSLVYLAGVGVGLIATDAGWPRRLVLSLLWPVGPAAFVIVVSGLTLVAAALWPWRVVPMLVALGSLAYLLL